MNLRSGKKTGNMDKKGTKNTSMEQSNTQIQEDTQTLDTQTPGPSTPQAGDTQTTPPNLDTNMFQQLMDMIGGINNKLNQNNKTMEKMDRGITKEMRENNARLEDKLEKNKQELEDKLEKNKQELEENLSKKIENLESRWENFNELITEEINKKVNEATHEIRQEVEHLMVEGLKGVDTRLTQHEESCDQSLKELKKKNGNEHEVVEGITDIHTIHTITHMHKNII